MYYIYNRICICSKVTRHIFFSALCIENVFLRMSKPSNDGFQFSTARDVPSSNLPQGSCQITSHYIYII